jgi:leader peptidase (prepilin peptidase)/N-methyltransferase
VTSSFAFVVAVSGMRTGLAVTLAVLAGALGACVGSFVGVALDRVPKGQSLGGRSHCVCGAQIRAADNVPIVGYLARRGRARCCGAHIPVWYLGVEVAGAVIGAGVFLLLV